MSRVDVWMPFFIGDYLRDTVDLTHAEHGAYILTILAYWSNGESLPDRKFRAICGKEFKRVSEFYVWCDHRWHHKRIDDELEKARSRMRVAWDCGTPVDGPDFHPMILATEHRTKKQHFRVFALDSGDGLTPLAMQELELSAPVSAGHEAGE